MIFKEPWFIPYLPFVYLRSDGCVREPRTFLGDPLESLLSEAPSISISISIPVFISPLNGAFKRNLRLS